MAWSDALGERRIPTADGAKFGGHAAPRRVERRDRRPPQGSAQSGSPRLDVDPDPARAHLEEAERHVSDGQRLLWRQLLLVSELRDGVYPTDRAETLLRIFLDILVMHIAHRDRLVKEIQLNSCSPRLFARDEALHR